jgi:UDP-N-acetyl-D-galactosamine dehydrogenase
MGLGYVGLPICLELSKKYSTTGFDINKVRVSNLKKNLDFNNEFKKKDFLNKKLIFTEKTEEIKNCNFYIICVPTPITKLKKPDLKYVKKCFDIISSILNKNDIIVLESTVYPGVTKSYAKKLENNNKLINNKDFFVCYSPERINPGDKENKLSKINKILAYEGKNKKIKKKLEEVYSKISKNLIFTNKINEAETAKGIENIQRDLNIAFYNEILLICERLNIEFNEVIRLAKTKWNFIEFSPGLVGGHCLPVDPYYLTYVANKKKYKSQVTLAGRSINESMKSYVLKKIHKRIKNLKISKKQKIKICLFGLTYKYGVSDIRNSQNIEIFNLLKRRYKNTLAYDPFLSGNNFTWTKNKLNKYDLYVFLSKGKIFNKIYLNLKNKDKIIDPFFYYSN